MATTDTPTPHGAMPELLPCPFCGGTARVTSRPDNADATTHFAAVACYCGGYSACAHKMARGAAQAETSAAAIAAWNTRAAIRRETHIIEPPDFDRRPGVTDGMYPDDLWQYACLVGYRYKLSEHDREQSTRAASPAIEPPKQQLDHLGSGECGGVQVPKYDPRMRFLENEKGTLELRIEGLSMRQIKDIFEQEYGALMWSEGCAYPSEKVKLQFIRADLSPRPSAPSTDGGEKR